MSRNRINLEENLEKQYNAIVRRNAEVEAAAAANAVRTWSYINSGLGAGPAPGIFWGLKCHVVCQFKNHEKAKVNKITLEKNNWLKLCRNYLFNLKLNNLKLKWSRIEKDNLDNIKQVKQKKLLAKAKKSRKRKLALQTAGA